VKRLVILLLLLMVVSVTPTHAVDEQYYLYPAIGYIGVGTDLPSGEMVEWIIDCTVFFEEVEMQNMIPTSDSIIDKDKYIARSFTLLEMSDVRISYRVHFFIHRSTLYLWNGELIVDEQTLEWIDSDRNYSWAQYKCFDVSGDWSIGFYASTGGTAQVMDTGMVMLFYLIPFGASVVILKTVYRWITKYKREEEWVRDTFVH